MKLLRSLFGGIMSAVWQTAKEYHYGSPETPNGRRQRQARTPAPQDAAEGGPDSQVHAQDADADAEDAGAHEAEDHAQAAAPGVQARQVTPEDVVAVLTRALPNLSPGDNLTVHLGTCIFPRGCSCVPALSGKLSRC